MPLKQHLDQYDFPRDRSCLAVSVLDKSVETHLSLHFFNELFELARTAIEYFTRCMMESDRGCRFWTLT